MSYFYENQKYRFNITPDGGEKFVDHEKNNRSGHFGHALVEYAPGKILAFYPNCNIDNGGHSGRGWMEYKRSEDGGHTWTDAKPLAYSKALYDLHIGYTSINEKAVLADNGDIILFNLICDVSKNALWEPYIAPTYIVSSDGGETWSEGRRFTRNAAGRVYDVIKVGSSIYVLFANTDVNPSTSDRFTLYVSDDNGNRFYEKSTLPFRSGRFYGNLEFLPDGRLIAYTYNQDNEYNIDYVVSDNLGKSWSPVSQTFFEHRLRNPQVIRYCDSYFAFGRSGTFGEDPGNVILYCSDDGIHWDDGRILAVRTAGIGAYSNVIKFTDTSDGNKAKLLYQSSHAYKLNQTNILHWVISAEEK